MASTKYKSTGHWWHHKKF